MEERTIIITEVTRFKAGATTVCTAGIEPSTGICIRPMPYLPFTECVRLGIHPGCIMEADFTPIPDAQRPHVEDCKFSKLHFSGSCASKDFRKVLDDSCFESIEKGFEAPLPPYERVIARESNSPRSIITVKVDPKNVELYDDNDSIKLNFTDPSGRQFSTIPITDIGFFDYAMRHRDSGALEYLNKVLSVQEAIYLRIGLSRFFRHPRGPAGFWVQVNGIYTFPKVLGYIRSYADVS